MSLLRGNERVALAYVSPSRGAQGDGMKRVPFDLDREVWVHMNPNQQAASHLARRSKSMPELIQIQRLRSHPNNPRLDGDMSKATVERLTRLMKERGFDEAHALIVRPHNSAFQIVSGHRRARAAKRAGVKAVPCWVRDMSDDEAHMLLRDENIQDGLHPIEEGKHPIDSGLTQRAYATRTGANRNTLKASTGGKGLRGHQQDDPAHPRRGGSALACPRRLAGGRRLAMAAAATPPLSPQRVVNAVPIGRRSELAALAQPQHTWLGELLHLLAETSS